MTDYELYHHGIKGQKWGVRRTAAQLGHRVANAASKAGKATGKALSKAGKATGKFAKKEATKAKKAAITSAKQHFKEEKEKRYYNKLHKKKLSQMTDKEIADLTKRVKQEATLKDAKYESRVQNARKFYDNVAKQPVNTFFSTYSKAVVEKAFKETKDDTGDNSSSSSSNKKDSKKSDIKTKLKNFYDSYEVKPDSVKTGDGIYITFETESDLRKRRTNPKTNPVIIRHGR